MMVGIGLLGLALISSHVIWLTYWLASRCWLLTLKTLVHSFFSPLILHVCTPCKYASKSCEWSPDPARTREPVNLISLALHHLHHLFPRDKTKLMALMKDFRRNSRDGRWGLPTIIVQTPQARYRPPQNPAGCLQIMQAINVTNDQVQSFGQTAVIARR